MELPETQERLKFSIKAMDTLMTTIDGDASVPKPGGLQSYRDAHQDWFTKMYAKGVTKLQEQYVAAAIYLTHPSRAAEYTALPQVIQDQVNKLADPTNGEAEAKTLCGGSLTWPV
jgi:hypothetical protein